MAENQRNKQRQLTAVLLTNWLKSVKFLLHWVKESGTASRQTSGNRIMEVLDRF